MTRSALRLALAAMAAVVVLGSGTAYAGYPDTPTGAQHDCGAGHDPLVGHYSAAVLAKALATLSGSDTEYTNCVDALRSALRALIDRNHPSGHGSKGRTGGGSHTTTTGTSTTVALPSSVIRQTLHAARAQGKLPKDVNGVTVIPGAVANSAFLNTIPTPLLVVLAALGAMLLAVGAYLLRSFVRARRTH